VARLLADPDQMTEISRRNVSEALTRHDHLHRWERVLDIAGLQATARMKARRKRLDTLSRLLAGIPGSDTVVGI
jgi:hypothetical protein